jgi:hypothetical protein
MPRPSGADGVRGGGLAGWALACDDIDAAVARARSHGYDPGEAADGQRAGPTGTVLRRRLTLNPKVDIRLRSTAGVRSGAPGERPGTG